MKLTDPVPADIVWGIVYCLAWITVFILAGGTK